MKFVCPLIVVEDIKKSREFYENVLGQTVKLDFGENITFKGDFAIHQKSHFQSLINNAAVSLKSNSFELYFEDESLDELEATLKDLTMEFVHEIREQPWKQRVLRFYDYDKNLIEVGEPMQFVAYRLSLEGYSLDDIVTITYLSQEMVQAGINHYSKR